MGNVGTVEKKNRLRDETGLNYLFHFNQTWISLLRGYLDIMMC